MDNAINLSLERRDPSVQLRTPLPTILRMDCKCGVPGSEKSSLKGRMLEGQRHLIQGKWFWHLSLIVARCLLGCGHVVRDRMVLPVRKPELE